jgi:HK97 family phage portal protein
VPHFIETRIKNYDDRTWLQRTADNVRSLVISGYHSLKDPTLQRAFGISPSSAGVHVDAWSALTVSAVWAAVQMIASDIGSLPLHLYKRLPDGGRQRYVTHTTYTLLNSTPNPETSSQTFRERAMCDVLLHGNFFAEIERDAAYRPRALWPIDPNRVSWLRDDSGLKFRIAGSERGDVILPASEVFHLRTAITVDGVLGVSPIERARESLGIGLAAQMFAGTFYGNGATSQVLSSDKGMPEKSVKGFTEAIEGRTAGVAKAHKLLVLTNGPWKVDKLGANPEESQLLEMREFIVAEVARWFNVSPVKLHSLGRATWANAEVMGQDYLSGCIRPWLRRWESEITLKLIPSSERNVQYPGFITNSLLSIDTAARTASYAAGIQNGWLSPNDVRRAEDLDVIPGGDTYKTGDTSD